jgi:hypothetical protein
METDLSSINQQLASLKARAAKINSEINSSPNKEIRRGRVAEYMEISANIAELKKQASAIRPEKNINPVTSTVSVKLATLLFPADNKVKYFATTLCIVDLLILLQEVFEDDTPALTAFFTVPKDQIALIPEKWYELVEDEKDAISE